jgi:hypothetical protein
VANSAEVDGRGVIEEVVIVLTTTTVEGRGGGLGKGGVA